MWTRLFVGLWRFCFLLPRDSKLLSVHLTTPHFKTNMPRGEQLGTSTYAIYTTGALGMKMTMSVWNLQLHCETLFCFAPSVRFMRRNSSEYSFYVRYTWPKITVVLTPEFAYNDINHLRLLTNPFKRLVLVPVKTQYTCASTQRSRKPDS